MRTTLTLDDDVAAKLQLASRRTGLNLDNISELIEPLEGPLAR